MLKKYTQNVVEFGLRQSLLTLADRFASGTACGG